MATLWAVSDLHISHRGNEEILDKIHPSSPDDWLIVAGDVAERTDDIVDTLRRLKARFATVIWVPGNHELYTTSKDPQQIFGVHRYDYLVQMCRDIHVLTPEDVYPLFDPGNGETPVRVVPMFLLYDYSFRPAGTTSKLQALAVARENNVVATDEFLLSPEPFQTREAWCAARIAATQKRLDMIDPAEKTILINHWPLRREPTEALIYEDFALWCGSELTAQWHLKYNAAACIYGHLHIPRTTWYDGVRFDEVSVGYPREWKRRGLPEPILRQVSPSDGLTEEELGDFGSRFTPPTELAAEIEKYVETIRTRKAAAQARTKAAVAKIAGAEQLSDDKENKVNE